jgi:hypothetical protein
VTARIKRQQEPAPLKVRLKALHIENYKGIDNLEIVFHGPKLASDPNVTVIGSENGLGKTSILECCGLLFLALSERKEFSDWWSIIDFMRYEELFIDPYQLLVRAGAKQAKISGTFALEDEEFTLSLTCGQKRISVEPYKRPEQLQKVLQSTKRSEHRDQQVGHFLSLLGVIGEPMIFPPFLYFNSYRKIQEGNPELGMMLSGERHHWRRRYGPESFAPISAFKIEVIRALMGRKGLFESVDEAEAEAVIQQLNTLIAECAHGNLAKLRDFDERAVELRVTPKGSESSYPFDGLSSGQKEVISTLSVNQAASHKLFVEGEEGSIDPKALQRLLNDTGISVKPLGTSFHMKSAAQAMHREHPNYYFLIDRDHHDETTVNTSWGNFPNPATSNLLIWRKRELQNYFLDPEYLSKSAYLKHKISDLKTRKIKLCSARVFFDIANQTITQIRESQKESWIAEFTNLDACKTSVQALDLLKNSAAWADRALSVERQVKFSSVEKIFRNLEVEFPAGSAKPEFSGGDWLSRMRGKPIFKALVTECFSVEDADGNVLTGSAAETLVAEELLNQELSVQPKDFQELHKLISARVKVKP